MDRPATRDSDLLRQPLSGHDWRLTLDREHPRERGVTGDESNVPDGLSGRNVPAGVPGCVHTDLLAADVIPDPYLADNELRLWWIGRCDWTYERTLDASAELTERQYVRLCFDGLDTLATVGVNGAEVLRSQNMHRRYEVDVKPHLKPGQNTLRVAFEAPVPAGWARQDERGELPRTGFGSNPNLPHNELRKMACNFGWDWTPVVPTCGIWRDVYLAAWDEGRLGDVRPVIRRADADAAEVDLRVAVDGSGTARARLVSPSGEVVEAEGAARAGEAALTLHVVKPQLWWPAGHGGQPLYDLTVSLTGEGGRLLDEKSHRVGLRTVELDISEDGDNPPSPVDGLGSGRGMTLKVNGRPVYCKGANWVPDDCFPHRVTPEHYKTRIGQAVGANMNMFRVWGGGTYESHDFYDVCDELGVMVWQDFLLACAAYHEDDDTAAEIAAEARDNVSRLARHVSLTLLNGCNENLWGYRDWRYKNKHTGKLWSEHIGDRGWGLRYYFDILPDAAATFAPDRPYWPGSPSSGPTRADYDVHHPQSEQRGNRHIWEVGLGPHHYTHYCGTFTRFCSEFGFRGQSNYATIAASIPADEHRWDSPMMQLHNKCETDKFGDDAQTKVHVRIGIDFDKTNLFDDWLYLANVMQTRAVGFGVGWFRALFPWNSGALFWQFNDCYPTAGWSAVDKSGLPKPLLHATRRFFAPRVINIRPACPTPLDGWTTDDIPLRVYLHNDHDDAWQAPVTLRLMNVAGDTLERHTADVTIAARSSCSVDVPAGWPRREDGFLVAESGDPGDGWVRGFWWFAPDKAASLPTPRMDVRVTEGGRRVDVTAGTLLREVTLNADRLHPRASAHDGGVTLLPGESFAFHIDTPTDLDLGALSTPPVLRCIGDR